MSLVTVKSADASFRDNLLQLQETFAHFDKLGSEGASNALSVEKISEGVRESTGVSFSERHVRDMVSAVSINSGAELSFTEFLKMMDSARHDAAVLHPRVIVHDLQEGMGALGIEAAPHAPPAAGDDAAEAKEDDGVDPRVAMLQAARAQAEAEYHMTREDCRAVFSEFDADGDGRLSAAELQAMLRAQGEKYSDEEVHAMIHLVDQSNSGTISYQAFTRLMMSAEE